MMSKCWDCGKEVAEGVFRCKMCLKSITRSQAYKRRRPLTQWEEMKLGFYRSEKKWIDNIRNRKIIYKDGKQKVVLMDGGRIKKEMPNQPKELLPPPKIKYIQPYIK